MRVILGVLACLVGQAAIADMVVPVRTLRAQEMITAEDLMLSNGNAAGALEEIGAVAGQEARITLYPGRPIRAADIGPVAVVARNDVVALLFRQGGLRIETEGRALGRGAAGETIRVMNLGSRSTVTGRILPDGRVEVAQ